MQPLQLFDESRANIEINRISINLKTVNNQVYRTQIAKVYSGQRERERERERERGEREGGGGRERQRESEREGGREREGEAEKERGR